MRQFAIPGAAVGVLYRGVEYVKGYGVTNVDYPVPVDADTLFRVGSTTKTFTGTTIMRLVEAGDPGRLIQRYRICDDHPAPVDRKITQQHRAGIGRHRGPG